MILDVYLIRDRDYSTVRTFTSEVKARHFLSHSNRLEIERVEVDVPYTATEPHRVLSLEVQAKAIEKVKTMEEMVKTHIDYVLYEVCKGNVAAASRVLDMSPSNLRHKIKQLGLK